MVKRKVKYESGAATAYTSRNQALKKLQLNLQDFRRLCILKGIYPHEPRHAKVVGKGSTEPKTYYLTKDIQFMLHEPLITKFRDLKVFAKKIRKALAKNEAEASRKLKSNRPKYRLDHLVKERYPSFIDAVRDLDDCLSLCFLFATLPKGRNIQLEQIRLCRRLTVEFMHYIIASRSLRKVFISIKGIYYQAEIMGQTVTWIIPHKLGYEPPSDVDYRIMTTFVEFYSTMLGFVNFQLYNRLGATYPPKLKLPVTDVDNDEDIMCLPGEVTEEMLGALTQTIETAPSDVGDDNVPDEFPDQDGSEEAILKAKAEHESLKRLQNLFSGLKFFLNREVPREALTFIIRSCGGQVSWEKTTALGSTYQEEDETITHQLVDRPQMSKQYLSRYYVQPQWVFDCVNARRKLKEADYFMGADLPAHLSPFVEEKEGDYVPPERQLLLFGKRVTEDTTEENTQNKTEKSPTKSSSKTKKEIQTPQVEEENNSSSDNDDDEDEKQEDSGTEENDDSDTEENSDNDAEDEEVAQPPAKKTRKIIPSESKQKKQVNIIEDKEQRKRKLKVSAGKLEVEDVEKKQKKETNEERKIAEMMMPKKNKRLYNKIMYLNKKKTQEAKKLEEKRSTWDKEQRRKNK